MRQKGSFMTSCQKAQALIAAALYETLDASDTAALDGHMSVCPACAAEMRRLQALVNTVPCEPITFAGDLGPAIRARIAEEGRGARFRWTTPLGLLAAASLLLVLGGYYLNTSPVAPGESHLAIAPNAVDEIIAETQALMVQGEFVAARGVLEAGIERVGNGPEAGELTLHMADLEYSFFNRYENSFNLYESVRMAHSDVWTQSSGAVKERFDLLTEAREASFQTLYQIDAAQNQGEQGIPALEAIMARYPGRALAGNALTVMASLVDGEGLDAFEELKGRVTNPVALAQIDIRLGEGYWLERQNPARGREILETVAQGPHDVPAKMAAAVLARLESDAR